MTPPQQLNCPAGHPSGADDYCDVCGSPMTAAEAASTPAPPAEPEAPAAVECPNCQVLNAPEALFCEACGYDYTTGTMPRPRPAPLDLDALDLDAPAPSAAPEPPAEPREPAEPGETPEPGEPAEPGEPVEPEAAAHPTAEQHPAAPDTAAESAEQAPAAEAGPEPAIDLPEAVLVEPKSSPAGARPDAVAGSKSQATPARVPRDAGPAAPEAPAAAAPGESHWVLEVWIDPEWYALQQSPDPMPSPGLPHVQPLRKRSLLIGRPSRSRGISPDIDCEPDSGISRRHAQLSTDGSRWFLEDLDSANGTYVAPAAAALPTTPIASGRRTELEPDDRIYLGAWTRLVLRPGTPEEQQLYAEG